MQIDHLLFTDIVTDDGVDLTLKRLDLSFLNMKQHKHFVHLESLLNFADRVIKISSNLSLGLRKDTATSRNSDWKLTKKF